MALTNRETLLFSAVGALVLMMLGVIIEGRISDDKRIRELEKWKASHEALHPEPVRRHY